MKKDWKVYAEKTFNNLKANSHKWRSSPNWDRAITRDYYIGVFDCGNPNPTGMISENAFHNKLNKTKTVHDHCLSPQFIDGTLKTKRSKMYYKNELVDNYDYEDQPHEIAAREAEETLYKEYHEERLESVL